MEEEEGEDGASPVRELLDRVLGEVPPGGLPLVRRDPLQSRSTGEGEDLMPLPRDLREKLRRARAAGWRPLHCFAVGRTHLEEAEERELQRRVEGSGDREVILRAIREHEEEVRRESERQRSQALDSGARGRRRSMFRGTGY